MIDAARRASVKTVRIMSSPRLVPNLGLEPRVGNARELHESVSYSNALTPKPRVGFTISFHARNLALFGS
jgi:hypothetical protein